MDDTPSRSRRTVLAALGTTLVSGTAVGADDSADESNRGTATMRNVDIDVPERRSRSRATAVRVPATTVDNGIVVQFRDCSRVRIFGNPLTADLVSVFVGYYDTNGRWDDGVYDAEADLPMTIDVNEAIGDDAASQVVIGGVDVLEQADGGTNQLVTAQPPAEWGCYDAPERS